MPTSIVIESVLFSSAPKMTIKRAGKSKFQNSAERFRTVIFKFALIIASIACMERYLSFVVLSRHWKCSVEHSRLRRPSSSTTTALFLLGFGWFCILMDIAPAGEIEEDIFETRLGTAEIAKLDPALA